MEWSKFITELLSQHDILSALLLCGLVYQTVQRGKDRDLCEKALDEARKATDETRKAMNGYRDRMQDWLLARSAQ